MAASRQIRHAPRNAEAIIKARLDGGLADGDSFVVSFVGSTPLVEPHVFVDNGERYDWRFAAGLHATIVVVEGVNAARVMRDLLQMTVLYPTIVDFERQYVASLIGCSGVVFQAWPHLRGCESWNALFG